jgi:hypothetical protein
MSPVIALAAVLLAVSTGSAARADPRTADDVIAEVRRATARYVDVARAREDGFVQISGMEPRHGVHFLNPRAQVLSAAAGALGVELDLAHPPILLYVERGGAWQLAGVEYALPSIPTSNPFPGATWERHEASCHYRDGRERAASRAASCPARHPASASEFVYWHPAVAFVHVWAWYPNPDGPFAPENPYLAAWGGSAAPDDGHEHRRSDAQLGYSELNHRIAGMFLLALALVTGWTVREGDRRPSRLTLGVLWVLFGVYIVCTADPEAWPMGPKSFREVFSDGLVIQHKLLAMLPIAIGAAEMLRALGIATRVAWTACVSAIAVIGGAALFWHDHEGGVHWDRTFLEHAAMGSAGIATGVALAVSGRVTRSNRLGWIWPALLLVTSVVLLGYAE